MKKRIAIFEEINRGNFSVLKNHMKQEDVIYFKDITGEIKKELENEIKNNTVIPLSNIELNYVLYLDSWKQAHKILDELFNRELSESKAIKNMAKLLDYPDIKNMYKKKLLDELVRNYELLFISNELAKRHQTQELLVYPKGDFYAINNFNNIKVISKLNFKDKIKNILRNVAYLLYPSYVFLKKINPIPKKVIKKEYILGIGVEQPRNILERNYYGSSILIDKTEFPKEDLLFIDESKSTEYLNKFRETGMNYTSLWNDRSSISFGLLKKLIVHLFPVWLKTTLLLGEKNILIRVSSKIMADYILWEIFLDNFNIKNYMRRMVCDNISKTILLRRRGTKTWFFYPNSWDEKTPIRTDICFMDYDCVIVNGERVKRLIQTHQNTVKNYIVNGIVYSQIVREIEEGKLESDLGEYLKKKNINKNLKIVGIFGTAHRNGVPLDLKNGIKFAQDLLHLLNDFKDIVIIFKLKYTLNSFNPELEAAYRKLMGHERAILFPDDNNYRSSACEIISKSNLVIGEAYSSVIIEALGAKKRAIYYDLDKEEGYYSKIPKLVAYDYEELKKLINYWLYESNEQNFNDYLDKYVKHELDGYLDGNALTRLRTMLRE